MGIKLIRNEFKKNFSIKQFVIIVLVMLLMNIAGIFIYENVAYDNWRDYAIEKREEYQGYIDGDDSKEITGTFEEEIALIDYSLEHNIPYGTTGIWKHLNKMIGFFSIITVILIYINSKVFLCEYECNTWKNLFCAGVKKSRIFLSKIIYCLFRIIIYLVIYFVSGVICGMALGMEHGMVELSVIDGQIIEINLPEQIAVSYGIMIFQMLFYLAITVMAVFFIKEKKMAIILPLIILFFSNTINQWINDRGIAQIIPFKYLERISEMSPESIIKAFVVLAGYSLIFLVVACTKFRKEEIVSY